MAGTMKGNNANNSNGVLKRRDRRNGNNSGSSTSNVLAGGDMDRSKSYKKKPFSSIMDKTKNNNYSNNDDNDVTNDNNDSQYNNGSESSDTNHGMYTDDVKEYPNSKTLLISSKRPRSFLERTCKELFAGGTDVIILCALGDAIPLSVQLQISLEGKKAATTIRIETTYSKCDIRPGYKPGLRLYMQKHPEFKGSRISPGYISFCDKNQLGSKLSDIDLEKKRCAILFTSSNGSTSEFGSDNENFISFLSEFGQTITAYHSFHKNIIEKAIEANKSNNENEIRSILMKNPTEIHPDIKISLCRICGDILKSDPSGWTGCVAISLFKSKQAGNRYSDVAVVCVGAPKASIFKTKHEFLLAVNKTGANIMTALCDFNGFIRRDEQRPHQKINFCRLSLFPDEHNFFKNTTKSEVAKAILNGLEEAYRYGPAPHINFEYDEDVFRTAWGEITGITHNKLY